MRLLKYEITVMSIFEHVCCLSYFNCTYGIVMNFTNGISTKFSFRTYFTYPDNKLNILLSALHYIRWYASNNYKLKHKQYCKLKYEMTNHMYGHRSLLANNWTPGLFKIGESVPSRST